MSGEMPRRKTMPKLGSVSYLLLACTWLCACTQHKVEVAPVEVKPIHITIDVNIKVDRALEDFFDDIDAAEETTTPDQKVPE
jgi:hypothetical protein